VPLSLINFRKFITGDEKRVLYDTLKKKSWVDWSWLVIDIDREA